MNHERRKEIVRPAVDLQDHYEEMVRQCKECGCGIILTVDGEAEMVLISFDEYRRMKGRLEMLEMLAEAESDVENGRTASIDSTFGELRSELAGLF